MASPPPDSFYLSALDKCFNDGHKLISWRTAFEALSDPDLAQQSPNLQHFLQDELSVSALAHASSPVSKPSAQSKSDFETRTAAVNATPTKSDALDTEQIKSDTLWLSEQTNIDQVYALRLVILEWQDRPASRILNGLPEEELISIAKAVGSTHIASLSSFQLPPATDNDDSKTAFDSDAARHSRLLCLLLLEREYLLAVSLILSVAHGLHSPVVPPGRIYGIATHAPALPWIQQVLDKIAVARQNGSKLTQADGPNGTFVTDGLESVRTALTAWEAGSQWVSNFDDPAAFDIAYRSSQLRLTLLYLQLIAAQVASLELSPPASAVQAWFEFVGAYGFLEPLQAQSEDQTPLVDRIQALVSLVSLQILRLPFTVAYLHDRSTAARPPPVVHDSACRNQIDQTLRQAADRLSPIASPAIFAWSVILQTLCDAVNPPNEDPLSDDDSSFTESGSPGISRQTLSSVPSNLVEIRDSLMQNNPDVDPVEFYARAAVDGCSVLDVLAVLARNLQSDCGDWWNASFNLNARISLLELSRQAVLHIGYRPEVFQCVLDILDCEETFGAASFVATNLANVFMADNDVLVPRLLHQAYLRYPYEISPLLKLCKSLVRIQAFEQDGSPVAQPLCDPSPSFTQITPPGFDNYELVREDENANGVRLTEELPIIINRAWRKLLNLKLTSSQVEASDHSSDQEAGEFCIPLGTTGIVISESRPFVIAWDHLHFPLRYLACLLSTAAVSSSRQNISTDEKLSAETQADIISILAKLVNSTVHNLKSTDSVASPVQTTAQSFLEEASELLDRNQDVISVIFELFEQQLSSPTQSLDDSSTTIVTSCLNFFSAILKVFPGRIWPLLTRSQLLDMDGRGGAINAFIAVESSVGSCQFLTACLSLLDALRQDVVGQSVLSSESAQKPSKRFQRDSKASQQLPKKRMSKIVYALTRSMADALQSLHSRPLLMFDLKIALSSEAVRIFRDILLDVYACDDSRSPSEKICGALAPAAELILASATATADSGLITSILLSISATTHLSPTLSLNRIPSSKARACTSRTLDLVSTLLDINLKHESQALHLEQQLLQIIPILARLFSAAETYKTSILALLSSLVQRVGHGPTQPPSLLGSLEAGNAWAFITLFTCLDKPLGIRRQEVKGWNLAATVISNRQQWMASFLMTGSTPKKSLRKKASEQLSQKAMLDMAITRLSGTQDYHHPTSLATLAFILHAQASWPWVTTTIRKTPNFMSDLLSYVDELSTNLSRAELEEPNQTYAAALIAEIASTYAHNVLQFGDTDFIELMISKLGFFRDNAVALPTYNSSLHSNLKRNFELKFPGCDLQSFKRALGVPEFGRDYCYDTRFAGQVLGDHQSWKGTKDKGFEEELSRANSNLSLVEAQLLLLSGWKSLCIELCQSLTQRESLQKQMISVANNCLLSNIQSNLPEAVFENLLQTRAELSLMVMQKLNSIRCAEPTMKRLLATAWAAILASGQDFEIAFSGKGESYYRTLLRILFLSIQPYAYLIRHDGENHNLQNSTSKRESPDQTVPVLLEVVSKVICTGFKSLCAQLHEDQTKASAPDFNLLICLLQAVLRVKGVSAYYAQLSLQLCDTGAHRYAVNLFSWADRLVGEADDPVFGDMSLSFLRELSNIPQMSEFLASEAVLSQLNSAPIMEYLRRGTSVGLQGIWCRGILPLVLNMLVSVGDAFAAEAAAFLNSFDIQLKRASSALSSNETPSRTNPLAGAITLTSAAELHTLAMISAALDKYHDSPAANAAAAAGYGEELDWDRARVREDVEAWLQSSRAQLKAKIAPSSPREAQLQLTKALGATRGGEDGCDSRLEELVVMELKGAQSYLGNPS